MAEIVFKNCETCQAQGTVDGKKCPTCFGHCYFYFTNNDLIYWDYPIDYLHIFVRELKQTINLIINIALIGASLLTLVFLYKIWSQAQGEPLPMLKVFITSGRQNLWFWILVALDMFFYYRLTAPVLAEQKKHKMLLDKNVFLQHNIADSLNKETTEMLDKAWLYARASKIFPVSAWHLLYIILGDKDIKLVLARLGLGSENLQQSINDNLAQLSAKLENTEAITDELKNTLLQAYTHMHKRRDNRIAEVDLLYGLVLSSSSVRNFFYDYNIDENKIENVIAWLTINRNIYNNYRLYRSRSRLKKTRINRAYTAIATPILDAFSVDLTEQAKRGRLTLCVGRDREMADIIQTVQSNQSSVILVGPSGVGKTNIVEGLANMMMAEEVPELFQDKRLVSVSIPLLISGATGGGVLEERLLAIINEVAISGNIILFIDNIHNIIGVSSQGNEGIDLSEVLAAEIRKSGVILIATSTNKSYVDRVEKTDLGQVLKKITINEPDKNQCIQILEAHVGYVENKNKVYFTYEAIERIYELSSRYIPDSDLPKKAIDMMDEVGIMIGQTRRADRLVRGEDVAVLVSKKTNIPLTQVSAQESTKLMNIEAEIHERIVGQNEAVTAVGAALRRARAELRDKKRPIVNLLFLGPTGVGKTELAKTVAEKYFGSEKNMIRLDMSEYQSQNSLPRLIGSAENGTTGLLTEMVRQKPFALLLLDEIEKAHKEVLNIFLQVMDDGRLTDAVGTTVDFTNLILVATSNAGTSYIQDQIMQGRAIDSFKDDLIKNEIRPIFSPEFINRFDNVIVFKPLSPDEIFQIAGFLMKAVKKNLEAKGIYFEWTEAAQRELAIAGFDPVFGARPLRRLVQERVDNALANFLLSGKIGRRDVIVYDVGDKISVRQAEGY